MLLDKLPNSLKLKVSKQLIISNLYSNPAIRMLIQRDNKFKLNGDNERERDQLALLLGRLKSAKDWIIKNKAPTKIPTNLDRNKMPEFQKFIFLFADNLSINVTLPDNKILKQGEKEDEENLGMYMILQGDCDV